ncbi:Rossmann-like fold-containing protein [Algibacter lectus]|uniref:Methyltransferase family protein n=1 Tax=Algibacter lectus TaxID=221126 RepID=A0A4V3HG52_9FLAO|nr:Rossmann-like fold-containing protein [Algibacter lectus]MWW26395.1 methyltransferase [Algibacter lectus]TDY60021.1 methyltransferase family protein [Algibacter lectus]
MLTDLKVNKPTPIAFSKTLKSFKRDTDIALTIENLVKGKPILIKDFYSDGMALLKDLHTHLNLKLPNKSFIEQQAYRSEYFKLSNLILLEVTDQKLSAKKSPSIGWLEKFYPENNHFFLTFPQIQGLNSAWQWYKNGVSIPVLRNKMHPYYGTYFPTRFEHLSLFDNWLKHYSGAKKSAIDIGIGCGVLSLLMVQHGFQKVFATDINPNAIFALSEFMGNTKLSRKIELDFGNLFGKWKNQTELIIFNPPWLPETHNINSIDNAIYYNKTLFPDFFEAAKQRLAPQGKLVLIFSNLAQITNASQEHPIETELADGNRFQLEKCYKKSVKKASSKTKRDQYWRSTEEVELWVLTNM